MSLTNDVRTSLNGLDQGNKAIQKFGLVMAAALFCIGIFIAVKGAHPYRAYPVLGVGLLFLIAALASPSVLKNVRIGWMAFALTLGWVMSRVILTILFAGVITPIGLTMRLLGKDPMHRSINPQASSYWIKREKTVFDTTRYERQF